MHRALRIRRLCAAIVLATAAPAFAADPDYDLVIRNARVVDGTGGPWYRGDVAVRGNTIVAVGPAVAGAAKRVIDANDQVVAPGFIDIHTHSGRNIFKLPTADNYTRQGVTTIMEGADGAGPSIGGGPPVPIRPWLDKLDALPKSINIGSFVGQGAIRNAVVGLEDRKATPAELQRMRELVAQDMRDGAFGLSTGLFYVPGSFTPTEEVVELQKVVAPWRGVHTSHMRNEAADVVKSVDETIAIGELGGVPTHVSHHKVVGKRNWGLSAETLRHVDAARARGVDVTIDMYPYTASSTSLHAGLLPKWALEGGLKATQERLKDSAQRARARTAVAGSMRDERGSGDPKNVVLSSCAFDHALDGKNMAELTRAKGIEPTADNAAETVLEIVAKGSCGAIFHGIGEEDLERIVRHPATMIASDGAISIPGEGVPHPRGYGTFARVLALYVRDRKLITLEEAVRKMSAMPAARLGLPDRGVLRAGMKADLVLFDPMRVKDLATYDNPHQYAEGFSLVVVNGAPVYENGAMTAARPGQVLYGVGRGKP